ncbi:cytochrome c oxidase assembly protein, partial [Actinotalea sp. JY-7885]
PATLPRWRPGRTVAWVAGAVLVAAALSPPVAGAAQHDHRLHMLQHLLLGMYAPLGLVLGAPLTALLGSLPRRRARGWVRVLRSRPVHVLSHPATAAVLSTGGVLVLYLTPLYGWTREHDAVNALVLTHLLLAGCLLTWSIAGPDPAPGRPGLAVRTAVLVVSAGTHAFLAKLLYARAGAGHPGGHDHTGEHAVEAAQQAATWMYYGGDGAELLLAAALFATWYRLRGRERAAV